MAMKANEAGSKAMATNPNEELFYALLHAETEDQVTKVLEERGMARCVRDLAESRLFLAEH